MFRYLLIICLLLVTSACSPATTESQPVESEETSAEEQEDNHDEDNDDHDEHEDVDEHDDHDDEDEHDDHDDDDNREHGAHEHGAAALTIAWSGNELAIDLETPAYNVVGFEYAPTSEEDIEVLDESVAALEAGNLLQFSPEADCIITTAVVETEMSEAEAEETHSDIDVTYSVVCQTPDKLESLDASGLFTRFPNFEALQVQWISDTQQSATEITADNPIVSFE